jgi:hypothetical protein
MKKSERYVNALARKICRQAARMSKAMHRLLTELRAFDTARGWHVKGATSCAQWLSNELGLGPSTAHERIRVARALGRFALIDAAFASGELSYSKVRAITRVVTKDTEELLVNVARTTNAAELEVFCRRFRQKKRPAPPTRHVRRRTMPKLARIRIELQLMPQEAELVWNALMRASGASHPCGDDPQVVTRVVQALTSLTPPSSSVADDTTPCTTLVTAPIACATEPTPCDPHDAGAADSTVTQATVAPPSAP